VIDQPVTIGALPGAVGQPPCGRPDIVRQCPLGLFEPTVCCPTCLAIAEREGVTLAGAE
jgi:hypothetical protein